MMGADELCVSCGYWVATHGLLCESCEAGFPMVGLEAAVIASALTWRHAPMGQRRAAVEGLCAAVDALLRQENADRDSDPLARRRIRRGGL